MSQKVKKAVIAAAGFGTRFLPATKAMPKEMLPVVDKPIIQYVVEEVVAAGIEDICIVSGWHKRSIEDHFDYPFELEKRLEEWGKHDYLEQVRAIAEMANFHYIRQKGPMGNGTPIWSARSFIGEDPFVYLWADEFYMSKGPSRCQQLIAAYEKLNASAILGSFRKTEDRDYKLWAYAMGKELEDGVLKVAQTVEKPGPGVVDSDYAVFSPYVFDASIVPAIKEAMVRLEKEGSGRELYVVEGINILLEQTRDVYAVEMKGGQFYQCGNKLDYLKSIVELGLEHEDLREDFRAFLKTLSL